MAGILAFLVAASVLRGGAALQLGVTARGAQRPLSRLAPLSMMGGKSRYGDDGSRLKGSSLSDGLDASLQQGFFSRFKFGTEVDVVPSDKPSRSRGREAAGGLGGGAYRNTESARFSSADKGQMIRKAKLEAYINSEEEPASPLVPRLISGAALLSILGGLLGVIAYYGIDGLLAAPTRM